MPSETPKQRRFMGAELARKREGKKTRTGMSEKALAHFAGGVKSHMPKGASQSPKGDLGRLRVAEANSQKGFKKSGGSDTSSEYFKGAGSLMPGEIGEKDPAIGTAAGPIGHRETYQRTGRFPGVKK
jgi:hypothetical protein